MVEANLTDELIVAGEHLLDRLDERGVSPDVAFWLYSPEDQTWKLLLGEIKLVKKGPKAGYAQIQSVLSKYAEELGILGLEDIVLERPDSLIVKLIRKAIRTDPEAKPVRFRNNVVNGTLIDDALVYRTRKRA